MPQYVQVDLDLPRERSIDLTVVLDRDRPFVDLLGYYELLYDEADPRRDRTRLILYFPGEAELPALRCELLLASLGLDDSTVAQTNLEREDYQQKYKEYFRPVVVSPRLAIVPEWHRGSPEEAAVLAGARRPIYLDPGMAFGTGTHPTTRLCLAGLDRRVRPGDLVCDAGSGSGVLGIGALALGADRVLAFDIEENAYQASRHNYALNEEPAGRAELYRGGFDLPELADFLERAHLVVANLTAAILVEHADRLTQGAHARLLLSGVWRDQRESVETRYIASGHWRPENIEEDEGWLLYDLVR